MLRRAPCSTLFPYTTLFRSILAGVTANVATRHLSWAEVGLGIVLGGGVFFVIIVASRGGMRSEEHTSELQSRRDLVCRLPPVKQNIQTHRAASLSPVPERRR